MTFSKTLARMPGPVHGYHRFLPNKRSIPDTTAPTDVLSLLHGAPPSLCPSPQGPGIWMRLERHIFPTLGSVLSPVDLAAQLVSGQASHTGTRVTGSITKCMKHRKYIREYTTLQNKYGTSYQSISFPHCFRIASMALIVKEQLYLKSKTQN